MSDDFDERMRQKSKDNAYARYVKGAKNSEASVGASIMNRKEYEEWKKPDHITRVTESKES